MEQILTNVLAGALGGNTLGKAQKSQSLGNIGNTLAGAAGGLAASTPLNSILSGFISPTISQYAGPALGGIITVYIVNFLKKVITKK